MRTRIDDLHGAALPGHAAGAPLGEHGRGCAAGQRLAQRPRLAALRSLQPGRPIPPRLGRLHRGPPAFRELLGPGEVKPGGVLVAAELNQPGPVTDRGLGEPAEHRLAALVGLDHDEDLLDPARCSASRARATRRRRAGPTPGFRGARGCGSRFRPQPAPPSGPDARQRVDPLQQPVHRATRSRRPCRRTKHCFDPRPLPELRAQPDAASCRPRVPRYGHPPHARATRLSL